MSHRRSSSYMSHRRSASTGSEGVKVNVEKAHGTTESLVKVVLTLGVSDVAVAGSYQKSLMAKALYKVCHRVWKTKGAPYPCP